MEERLQKIVELINSRYHKDQSIGKQMISHLTLSEAWVVCNSTIKARNLRTVEFLFELFDPRTYPIKKMGKRWALVHPDQRSVPRNKREWCDIKVGEKYVVLKKAANPDRHMRYQSIIISQTGNFVKITGDFYIFDTFRVGKKTLMSIEPARK
jgi:hypothetical protein